MAETKVQAIKEAQELADLYHSPYYVCRQKALTTGSESRQANKIIGR